MVLLISTLLWKAITFLCGHSLLHDVVSPLCDVVSPLCDVVSSLYDGVSPLRDVVLSLCDVVSPLCDVVLPLCDVVSPLRGVVSPLRGVVYQASKVRQASKVSKGDSLVLHCASVLRITQSIWRHFKMASFRAGKLARKMNGRFQSTAVKSRMENVLDSRKRKSNDSRADAMKVSFQFECESETELSGRRVVEFGLLSKELADGRNYCKSPLQLSSCWKETVSGLGSFLYISLWESFHQRKRAPGDLLMRSEK